jgi:hypothetical protein
MLLFLFPKLSVQDDMLQDVHQEAQLTISYYLLESDILIQKYS